MLDEVRRQQTVSSTESTAAPEVRKSKVDESRPEESPKYASRVGGGRQLRTTDLIPKRSLSYALVVVLLAVLVGGLNCLAYFAEGWRSIIGDAGVEALSVSGPGSLGNWLLSFLFIASSLVCLQIFALRQHRYDDYRGTYRIWVWLAALFLLGSVGCVVRVGEIAQNVLATLAKPEYVQNVFAVVALKLVLLSLFVIRGLFEVRASKGTLALLSMGWIALTASVCIQVPYVKSTLAFDYETCRGNMHLIGVAFLLMAQITYARFVYLQVKGLLPITLPSSAPALESNNEAASSADANESTASATKTQSKSDNKSKRKPSAADHEKLKELVAAQTESKPAQEEAEPSQPQLQYVGGSVQTTKSSSKSKRKKASSGNSANNEGDQPRKLTRAEQKRLRKQQKRQRRAA